MKRLTIIIAVIGVVVAAHAQTAHQWRDSLAVLNRLIEQQPRSTDLRLRKAAVNIELEQWEYAVEEYGRVLAIDDHNPAALFFRAYANVHLRQYAMLPVRLLRCLNSNMNWPSLTGSRPLAAPLRMLLTAPRWRTFAGN